jgi:hypothetical protein
MGSFRKAESGKNPDFLHLERIISIIPVPYYWGWMILGGLFFLFSLLLLLFFEQSLAYVCVSLILSILIALQGILITWALKKIRLFRDILLESVDLPKEEIFNWYEKNYAIITNHKRMIISGFLLIVLIHVLGIDNQGFSFQSFPSYIFIKFEYYFASYITGLGLYALIMMAIMVHKISYLPLNVNVFLSNIQDIGILYSKFTICAAVIYSTWGVFHRLVPLRFSSLEMTLWFVFFGMFLIIYFIMPQYSIHKIIVKTKKEKAAIFSSQLRTTLAGTFNNPTSSDVTYLKDMLVIQHQLDAISEWPFSSYEVLHIALIVVIPFIVVALEVLMGILR